MHKYRCLDPSSLLCLAGLALLRLLLLLLRLPCKLGLLRGLLITNVCAPHATSESLGAV